VRPVSATDYRFSSRAVVSSAATEMLACRPEATVWSGELGLLFCTNEVVRLPRLFHAASHSPAPAGGPARRDLDHRLFLMCEGFDANIQFLELLYVTTRSRCAV
jgi:hypothetical protein